SGPYNSWIATSYIVFGSPDIGESGNLDLTNFDSSQGIRGLDATIHPAGDWNGDGISDLFVDFRLSDTNYIVFGGSAVASDGVLELSELNGSNSFATTLSGTAISNIGDVNGDGIDDLAWGSSSFDNNSIGVVHVIFGGMEADTDGILEVEELDGSNGFSIEGIDDRSRFGFSVSDAGDLNGDGIDDFIAGAPFTGRDPYYSYAPGAGYVIFGNGNLGENGSVDLAALDGSNGFRLGSFDFYTGWSVSSAGDFNGDGFDDVVAGTPGLRFLDRDPRGTSAVIFGGTDVGAGGTFALDELDETIGEKGFFFDRRGSAGWSVSGGGDINGDGLDDILVGAPNTYTYRPNYDGYQTGAVYILFGSSELGVQPPESPRIAGENLYSYLGIEVSHIGDINGDSLDDFIVRGWGSESYVIFGNSPPELDLNGNSPGIDITATLPEGETSVLLSPDVTLDDNKNTLVSARVSIVNSDVSPEEFLSADTSGTNISASYSDRVLTLSGTDSLENYQQVLRTIRYNTTKSTTEILDRTIEFIVDDNSMVANFSPVATTTLNIGTRTELSGTSGADFLIGTPSKDVITGFQGADYLSGGGGRDRFVYTDLTDVGDVIVDFEVGIDVIDLSQLVENLNYADSNPSAYEVVEITDIGIGSMVSIDPDGYGGSNPATPYLFLPGVSAESLDYSRDFWV
ncbi:MAG: type I secretion C-terminal target domain-containing protein, partial [Geitlerinemataceae cyanobacterium]